MLSKLNPSTSLLPSSAIRSKPNNCGKITWPDCPSQKQDWSLPGCVIYYIAKNPLSAKCYQKLVQTCKFFFEKNPILVVKKLYDYEEEDGVNTRICSNINDECMKNNQTCCVQIDLHKLSSKIWLTEVLSALHGTQDFMSFLCSKLFRCEIFCFKAKGKFIKYDDFKSLVSCAKGIYLFKCVIKYNGGNIVMLDKILELFPSNLEEIIVRFPDDISLINASTMASILKLQNLGSLKNFELEGNPGNLNIKDLSAFITKNAHTFIQLCFRQMDIFKDYKNQLDGLINEIIESEVKNCIVEYEGQDERKFAILYIRSWKFQYGSDDDEDMNEDDDEYDDEDMEEIVDEFLGMGFY
uniref:Uncharacterized protein n=1 Tax=Panagrolaimus sp. PS1159 TaxID=55785 RepID=A0AC35FJ81_9BILA